jgi:hypothetical protein
MKVGDLVKFTADRVEQRGDTPVRTGIIIEQGVFVGRRDIKIMWDDSKIFTANSKNFEVINASMRK